MGTGGARVKRPVPPPPPLELSPPLAGAQPRLQNAGYGYPTSIPEGYQPWEPPGSPSGSFDTHGSIKPPRVPGAESKQVIEQPYGSITHRVLYPWLGSAGRTECVASERGGVGSKLQGEQRIARRRTGMHYSLITAPRVTVGCLFPAGSGAAQGLLLIGLESIRVAFIEISLLRGFGCAKMPTGAPRPEKQSGEVSFLSLSPPLSRACVCFSRWLAGSLARSWGAGGGYLHTRNQTPFIPMFAVPWPWKVGI